MSLSLRACKRTPRCFVHTAKVLGVWRETGSKWESYCRGWEGEPSCHIHRAHSTSNRKLRQSRHEVGPIQRPECQNCKEKDTGSNKNQTGQTDLHHGLLVLTVLHLGCRQVNDATLYWVFVTVIDEDIRATNHNEMLSPVAGKWLLEMQVSLLRYHWPKGV